MKTKHFFQSTLVLVLFVIVFGSCKKSSSEPDNGLSALNGTWQTTVWGGANDTARAAISSSSAAGTLSYLGASAKADSKFSVSDVIYSDIEANGDGTFTCTGTYRYTGTSGSANSLVSTTQATLTLQNGNTTLFAHYTKDAVSGITPPDYYWYKQ